MKHGKKYRESFKKLDAVKKYPFQEALTIVAKGAFAKFDESIEVSLRLGVDPRHADQIVRGTVVLPNGTGKVVRVLVLAKGDKADEARKAGADFVGAEDFVEKIQGGWTDVDTIITTNDMMGLVGKLGKILGPRGLMPNPKSGTVTMDIARAVNEAKAGKVEYRTDRAGNIAAAIGKASFEVPKLQENFKIFMDAILRAKPSAAKGTYLKTVTVSSTMGPGVRIDPAELIDSLK